MQRGNAYRTTFIGVCPYHLVPREPHSLAFVPDRFKTEGMCHEIMRTIPNEFHRIPDLFKTQEMCIKVVKKYAWQLYYVPDHFKTQEMCNEVVRIKP